MSRRVTIVGWAIMGVLCMGSFAFAATSSSVTLPSSVIIQTYTNTNKGVDIYTDQACTKPATKLDFGTVKAGANPQLTVYLKNPSTDTLSVYADSDMETQYGRISTNNPIVTPNSPAMSLTITLYTWPSSYGGVVNFNTIVHSSLYSYNN